MAAVARELIEIHLGEQAPGRWLATALGRSWGIAPPWPAPATMLRFAWLAEDAGISADLDAYAHLAEAQAQRLGDALWSSVVSPAPWRIRRRIAGAPVAVRIQSADPGKIAALGLLRRPGESWIGLPPNRLSVVGRNAAAAAPRDAPLRLLLVSARPYGVDDAPYCHVALPLARALGRAGLRLERVAPARLGAIRERLAAARRAGRPYTALVYDGHGSAEGREGRITLESGLGTALIGARQFADCLGDPAPRLVVLAACRTARVEGEVDRPSGFAQDVARLSGAEVIGLHHNASPLATAALVERLFEALCAGLEVDAAAAEARHDMDRRFGRLTWSGLVHYRSAPLRLLPEPPSQPAAAVPGDTPRHLDTLALDRAFQTVPLILLAGPPLAGKSSFLDFYQWWHGTLAGEQVAPLRLCGSEFATPDDLIEAHERALVPDRLVTVDDVSHWMALPPADWNGLRARARAGAANGVRWLISSRVAPPATLPPDLITTAWFLWPAAVGLRDDLELAELAERHFGRVWREDPWMRLLLVALRCEPMLLDWAGTQFRAGLSAEEILERYVFAHPDLTAWLAAHLPAEPALDRIDPMLGWAFGMEGSHLLASLATPEETWEGSGREPAAARARAAFEAAGAERLAFRLRGVQWIMSPSHAVLLRARSPVDGWSAETRTRMVRFMTFLSEAFDLNESDTSEALALRRRHSGAFANIGPVSDIAIWAELLLQLPAAFAACQLAVMSGRAKDLGDIASGLGRVCMEFDALESCRAWLLRWSRAVAAMPATDAADLRRGRASLAEELERIAFFTGQQPIGSRARGKLSSHAGSEAAETADIPALLDRIAANIAAADAESRIDDLDQLVNDLALLGGAELKDARSAAAVAKIAEVVERRGSTGDRIRLHLLQAHVSFNRHAFDEARAALARAEELGRSQPAYDRYLIEASAIELLAGIGDESLLTRARNCLSLARMLGAPLQIGNALLQLANAHAARGELEQARHFALEALSKLNKVPLFRTVALLSIAKINRLHGDLELAEAYRARAEEAAAAIDHRPLLIEALSLAPILAWQGDDTEAAMVSARRLLAKCEEADHLHGAGVAHMILAECSLEQGDPAAAAASARIAIEQLRPVAGEGFGAYARETLAKACHQLGRLDEAYAAQREAALLYEAYADPALAAHQWAAAEGFAVMIESQSGAEEANLRVTALAPDYVRTQQMLTITAVGWAMWGEIARARSRAILALRDTSDIPDDFVPMLRELADLPEPE